MKIQLDTINRTIKLEQSINLGEFVKSLDMILPNAIWKEYTLEVNTVIYSWSNPTVIYPTYPATAPVYPWITYTTSDPHTIAPGDNYTISSGVYNIQTNF